MAQLRYLDDAGHIRLSDDWADRHGHGTACAGVIRWMAPDVELIAVRVLDASLAAHSPLLVTALEHLSRMRIHVANLSLGAVSDDARAPLAHATRALIDRGVIVVAATRADGVASWPADQEGVIGVDVDPSLSRWAFGTARRAGIDLAAAGTDGRRHAVPEEGEGLALGVQADRRRVDAALGDRLALLAEPVQGVEVPLAADRGREVDAVALRIDGADELVV